MTMWPYELLDQFAKDYTVVIFDNQGIGLSKDDGAPLSIPQMADTTMSLLRELGISRPHLWGWSLGGLICLMATARHGVDVGSVTCVANFVGGADRLGAEFASGRQDVHPGPESLELLNRAMFPATPSGDRALAAWMDLLERMPQSERQLDTVERQVAATNRFLFDDGGFSDTQLAAIDNPALFMHGGLDQICPPAATYLVETLPNGWLVRMSEAGHGLWFQNLDEVVAITKAFLHWADRRGLTIASGERNA